MPELGLWTVDEIASELGMSRDFVITAIKGRSPFKLEALKMGGAWLINDAEAQAFIKRVREQREGYLSPGEVAKALGKSRKYVLDALTGYGGRKSPSLKAEKRGDRWIISKEEAERFIKLHAPEG